jgi:hypothetical protein
VPPGEGYWGSYLLFSLSDRASASVQHIKRIRFAGRIIGCEIGRAMFCA